MNKIHHHCGSFTMALALLLTLLGLVGCTETRRVDFISSSLSAREHTARLPATGALVLDDALKNYNGEARLYGGKALIPLGEYLCEYANAAASGSFRQVRVCNSLSAAANTADVILVPKVVRSDFSVFGTTFVISVEWTVKDRSGQNLIWLNTFDGQGTETKGNGFDYRKHNAIRTRKMFDDLTGKTLQGFSESVELKRLAATNR